MLLWKTWFDVRRRFWLSLLVVTLHAVFSIGFYATLAGRMDRWDLTAQDARAIAQHTGDLVAFLAESWAGSGLVLFLAVFLTMGGVMTEARKGTASLTLSLPVAPGRWVWTQAGLSAALVLALAMVGGVLVAGGAYLMGAGPRAGVLLLDALLVSFGALAVVGLTMLATAWCRDVPRAALVSVGGIFVLSSLPPSWSLWTLAQAGHTPGPFPWGALLLGLLLSVGGTLAAAHRFAQIDH